MQKVVLDEILGLERYERARTEVRQRIIELKKHRRVAVGDRVTFVFENHDTMLFQIQEMLRAERIVDLDRVREEVDVYNALIPNPGELSATMLIEITDGERVREQLLSLLGIGECVRLEITDRFVVPAQFEPGHSTEDKLSAVQYVRFTLDTPARLAFRGDGPARLVIDHPNYRHATAITGAVRASLAHDLPS